MEAFKNFINSPYLDMLVGVIILISGLLEAYDTLYKDIFTTNFGAHHGMIVLGCFQILKALPSILAGLKKLTEQ